MRAGNVVRRSPLAFQIFIRRKILVFQDSSSASDLFLLFYEFVPMLGTLYSHVGNTLFPRWEYFFMSGNPYAQCNQIEIRLNKSKEFCVFAQDLTVSRKGCPVYRCFTRF